MPDAVCLWSQRQAVSLGCLLYVTGTFLGASFMPLLPRFGDNDSEWWPSHPNTHFLFIAATVQSTWLACPHLCPQPLPGRHSPPSPHSSSEKFPEIVTCLQCHRARGMTQVWGPQGPAKRSINRAGVWLFLGLSTQARLALNEWMNE